ncbi:MAG: outer membrane lipoprotein-sorting protein, partial [Pseudomonadota bacterium]
MNVLFRASAALAIFAAALLDPSSALADGAKGYEIVARSDATNRGFGASSVNLTMTLSDPSGRTTTREMRIDTLEVEREGLGDRSLTQFFSPPDVECT